jgi:hypothetical protein
MLLFRLFFRQVNERGGFQGKIGSPENFSINLSTETVDTFSLAPVAISLQPKSESKG